ncbi:MAG TPA: ATP-binding protein [Pseudonocardiaceae bacterium]|jgi:signal transduction histidine kinase|nr:ATP-binding protein [Pseudonocardiaceae bacterium]
MSARLRLTALYGGLCLASGLVLVGVVFALSSQTLAARAEVVIQGAVGGHGDESRTGNVVVLPKDVVLPRSGAGSAALSTSQIKSLAANLRDTTLHQLQVASGVALLVTVVFALLIGWWIAGRVLRPLHTITMTARNMSTSNMHERIALHGPDDELRELADTFDGMLDRLDRAFASQRRFIANASHELRTPLAVERATIQVGLAGATPDQLPKIAADLLKVNRRSEALIEGLLALARSEAALAHREPIALDQLIMATIGTTPRGDGPSDVDIQLDLEPTTVLGDELLLGQLVENLVRNALRYNLDGGWIRIRTAPGTGLEVSNSGPVVPEDEVDGLVEPFRRGSGAQNGGTHGAGLGLSIVRSIAEAHDGSVRIEANPAGGLHVTVAIPWPESIGG